MGVFLFGFAVGLVVSALTMLVGWYCSAISDAPEEID